MISALVLSLALAGARANSGAATTVAGDDPPVQLWISNDRRFYPGDRANVQVRTKDDSYLLILHVDTDGHLRVLFPLDPTDDDFVRGGRKYEVRGRGGRESFTIDSRTGQGTVYAAASADPFKFDDFVVDGHWDYRALAPQRLSAQPESELNDLVRRMSQDDFDYDILTYDVLESVAYSDSYSSSYYPSFYYSGYYSSCFGCWYRPGFSIGLSFGGPYVSPYYDPFYPAYHPFYDPFFYDPYFYPAYYAPIYYPHAYYPYYNYPYGRYGGYGGYYNTPGHRYYGPYTPYRFRGNDLVAAGYRSRGFSDIRSVQTVYGPPGSRVMQPGTANPTRRVASAPGGVGQSVAVPAARRNGQRVESAPVARDGASRPGGRTNAKPGSRQENWPQDVSPSRNGSPTDVTPRRVGESGGRPSAHPGSRQEDWPRDVSPSRNGSPTDVTPRRVGESGGRPGSNPSSRQEEWPQDVSPRRSESPRDVTPRRAEIAPTDATPRGPAPRDVTPRRAQVDRPQVERAPVLTRREPQVDPRSVPSPQSAPSAGPPSERSGGGWGGGGGDRGGGGRSAAPAAPSRGGGGWGGGGGGGGGGGQAPSGGGGRRR